MGLTNRVFSYARYKAWCTLSDSWDGGWAIGCDGQPIYIDEQGKHHVFNSVSQ